MVRVEIMNIACWEIQWRILFCRLGSCVAALHTIHAILACVLIRVIQMLAILATVLQVRIIEYFALISTILLKYRKIFRFL